MHGETIICDNLLISFLRSTEGWLAYRDPARQLGSEGQGITYPKEASCQLMKHRIAVL
jgi:hypothetical protein